MDAELADWHDDLMHDIVVADMMRGASPEEAAAFGQYAEECFAELVSDELKAEIDRQMLSKQVKASIGEMDPSWQKLYDTLKDPTVSKESKDKIWNFIHLESRRFMEFAYPPLNINVEDMQKTIDKLKKGQEDNGKRDDA